MDIPSDKADEATSPQKDISEESPFKKALASIKGGGGYDHALSGYFLTQGIPVPPSVVRRLRTGVERLIDGGFDIAAGYLRRIKDKSDFDYSIQKQVVNRVSQSGAELLASQAGIPIAMAASMLNEYGLKLDNRTAIAEAAFRELAENPPTEDSQSDTDISRDWLNHFSDIAAQKSDPEMQRLMGQILAGEIRKPGSFSPLTISALSTITSSIAQKFELLCSASFEMNGASVVSTDIFPDFSYAGIPELGIRYLDVLALRSHLLLAHETGSSYKLRPGQYASFTHCGKRYLLGLSSKVTTEREIKVALFSQVGTEVRRLVSPEPAKGFGEKLRAAFAEPDWQVHEAE